LHEALQLKKTFSKFLNDNQKSASGVEEFEIKTTALLNTKIEG